MASSILRRTAKVSLISPSLMLPAYQLYRLGEEKVVNVNCNNIDAGSVVVGSSHGWVGLWKRSSVSLSLWNPMSGSRIKLPPTHTTTPTPLPDDIMMRADRLIVDDEECGRAIMIGPLSRTLAACCPGRCTEWTQFGRAGRDTIYDEVAYSRQNKLLFSLQSVDGLLEGWDISEPRRPRLEWTGTLPDQIACTDARLKRYLKNPGFYCVVLRHLVSAPDDDDLFLVTRYVGDPRQIYPCVEGDPSNIDPLKTFGFDVDRIRIHGLDVSYMDRSLDGVVIFVGVNDSFAVSAADFPHLKPDSIYFTDHAFMLGDGGGPDIGIFDYKNRTVSSCYYPALPQYLDTLHPPPFWFTPNSTTYNVN